MASKPLQRGRTRTALRSFRALRRRRYQLHSFWTFRASATDAIENNCAANTAQFGLYILLFNLGEASRGSAARSVTVQLTGCGFDPHSRR